MKSVLRLEDGSIVDTKEYCAALEAENAALRDALKGLVEAHRALDTRAKNVHRASIHEIERSNKLRPALAKAQALLEKQ